MSTEQFSFIHFAQHFHPDADAGEFGQVLARDSQGCRARKWCNRTAAKDP